MSEFQKLPIGIQDFESLRRNGYLYIDKTEHIYNMISSGKYFFLSRPRRFGKSLLLSTINAFFSGKKDLFDGMVGKRLAISNKSDTEWETYPVLHLDLNTGKYDSKESLDKKLDKVLSDWEDKFECQSKNYPLEIRFETVIKAAHEKTGQCAVILVDEYDKPILQAIGNSTLQLEYRNTLKAFYSVLKSMDHYIQFALLTGVAKFGKISIFSDLNNLIDITMNSKYWDICGISESELNDNFKSEISALANSCNTSIDDCILKLRDFYDGYHFCENVSGVYNPFSLLNAFYNRKFSYYWFETGTPTYLVDLLKAGNFSLENLIGAKTDSETLRSIDSDHRNPIPTIYQSGYLTIKDYDPEFNLYTLGFPNKEVEDGFLRFLFPYYTSSSINTVFSINQFVNDIKEGRTEHFIELLKSLFADTPYELVKDFENHYQNAIWLLTKLMGFYVHAEYHTSQGRIDLVLQTSRFCYVMEFKLNGTAEEALKQIHDKQYSLPFETGNQKIICVGISFNSKIRNIEQYIIE